jgi:mannose-6-phosphate isomerase-like protein (cupin superfamily)
VDAGPGYQVKHITVKPGHRLSLQTHRHRAEHWVVISGTAEVVRGEDTLTLVDRMSVDVPVGCVHRLANPGPEPLHLVEVQTGTYVGEDDIVRLDDAYGRDLGVGRPDDG